MSTAMVAVRSARRVWTEQHKVRIFPMIERWHCLGPRSAFELLDELVGIDPYLADDIECLLQKYSRLDRDILEALDGIEIRPPLAIVEGGRR